MELKDVVNLIGVQEEIDKIWSAIENKFNKNEITISSEKTLVFKFAWLLNSCEELKPSNIDFEAVLFNETFTDGKFLDLYFDVEYENNNYRVGIEFKFPNRKLNGSGGKEVRQKMINDLKKLDFLIQEDKIDLGVFLCATNEEYYLNLEMKTRTEGHFATYNGKKYDIDTIYPINSKYPHKLKTSSEIVFNWRNPNLI